MLAHCMNLQLIMGKNDDIQVAHCMTSNRVKGIEFK